MGLLEKKLKSESKNYINALNAIEFLAKYTEDDYEDVAKYLLSASFDQYVESYTINDFYKFHPDEAMGNDGAYLKTYSTLIDVLTSSPFGYDMSLSLNSFNFPELFHANNCYWKKDDFFNAPAILELNFNADQLEKIQSEFKPNLGIAKFVEKLAKNGVDAPIHIVKMFNQDSYTIEEASLFIHSNKDEQGVYHFDTKPNKHSLDLIADFIKSNSLVMEKDGTLRKENLKAFLYSIDIIIKGFNENCTVSHSLKQSIEIDKLNAENEKLKAEIERLANHPDRQNNDITLLKNKISELESLLADALSKSNIQENDELTPEQEIPNTRTRGNVLKIIAILTDMADLPNEPYTAFNMMEAHA